MSLGSCVNVSVAFKVNIMLVTPLGTAFVRRMQLLLVGFEIGRVEELK